MVLIEGDEVQSCARHDDVCKFLLGRTVIGYDIEGVVATIVATVVVVVDVAFAVDDRRSSMYRRLAISQPQPRYLRNRQTGEAGGPH